MLLPLGLQAVVQPAFEFLPLDARADQPEIYSEMSAAGPESLVVFTSPRSVAHGVSQLPEGFLFRTKVAAIGPATAKALANLGVRVSFTAATGHKTGFTSEALLETLAQGDLAGSLNGSSAFIIAAPRGRQKLLQGLGEQGWKAKLVMVYKSEPSRLDKVALGTLKDASGVLSVWTSANAMKAMSQRLPPAIWFQLCQGDWLVISDRLKRLARAYGPTRIKVASGPRNRDLFSSIRSLC